MKRIAAAAVKHGDNIYTGRRHAEIMHDIWDKLRERIPQEEQGFLTSDGEFVSRWRAGAIAYRAGQTETRKQTLLSEDLW